MAVLDLPARIADLERTVAELADELKRAGGDSLQSNVLTVDPATGTIGAHFTGDITANSLIDAATNGQVFNLDALGNLSLQGALSVRADTSPDAVDTVQWLAAGKVFADLYGYTPDAKAAFAALEAKAQDPAANSQVRIAAVDDLAQQRAFVQVFQSAEGASSNVQAKAGTAARTIVDNSGHSDFVQTPAPGTQTALAGGASTLTWSAGQVATVTVTHGIGRVPFAAVATIMQQFAASFSLSIDQLTSTQMRITGWLASATTGSLSVGWTALG